MNNYPRFPGEGFPGEGDRPQTHPEITEHMGADGEALALQRPGQITLKHLMTVAGNLANNWQYGYTYVKRTHKDDPGAGLVTNHKDVRGKHGSFHTRGDDWRKVPANGLARWGEPNNEGAGGARLTLVERVDRNYDIETSYIITDVEGELHISKQVKPEEKPINTEGDYAGSAVGRISKIIKALQANEEQIETPSGHVETVTVRSAYEVQFDENSLGLSFVSEQEVRGLLTYLDTQEPYPTVEEARAAGYFQDPYAPLDNSQTTI